MRRSPSDYWYDVHMQPGSTEEDVDGASMDGKIAVRFCWIDPQELFANKL